MQQLLIPFATILTLLVGCATVPTPPEIRANSGVQEAFAKYQTCSDNALKPLRGLTDLPIDLVMLEAKRRLIPIKPRSPIEIATQPFEPDIAADWTGTCNSIDIYLRIRSIVPRDSEPPPYIIGQSSAERARVLNASLAMSRYASNVGDSIVNPYREQQLLQLRDFLISNRRYPIQVRNLDVALPLAKWDTHLNFLLDMKLYQAGVLCKMQTDPLKKLLSLIEDRYVKSGFLLGLSLSDREITAEATRLAKYKYDSAGIYLQLHCEEVSNRIWKYLSI